MKYKACVYIDPKGKIDVGTFDNSDEAMIKANKLSHYIIHNSNSMTSPAVEEIKENIMDWLYIEDDLRRFKCSNCWNVSFGKTRYCPHCGVKMNI